MVFFRVLVFVLTGAVLDMTQLGAAENPQSLCTKQQMEKDAASVESPCTELLKEPGLSSTLKAELYYIRGRGRHRSYQIDGAAQDYDKAIVLEPTNSAFYVDRANTKLRRDDIPAALSDIETALKLDRSNTRALVTLGIITKSSGRVEEGLKLIDQALSIDPLQPFGLLFRQRINADRGRLNDALRDADTLVAQDPDRLNAFGYVNENGDLLDFHIVALQARSQIHEKIGYTAKAEADLQAAVTYRPSLQAYLARAAFLSRQNKREADALADWNLIASMIDTPTIHYNRALMLIRLQRPADAVEALNQTIELDDEDASAYELRGKILRQLKRFDEAYRDLTKAMEHDPSLIKDHMPGLWQSRFYKLGETPSELTPALRDALKACSLDSMCRGG